MIMICQNASKLYARVRTQQWFVLCTRMVNAIGWAFAVGTALLAVVVVIAGIVEGFTFHYAMLVWCMSFLATWWLAKVRKWRWCTVAIVAIILSYVWLSYAVGASPSNLEFARLLSLLRFAAVAASFWTIPIVFFSR